MPSAGSTYSVISRSAHTTGRMADIFISYSKSDHALALKLSAFLVSEGWSVWWDKSLGAADHYRDEIMKHLAAAKAVITIWSPNSIQSDWVRAEAGRAKADGKLIPVKTPELTYADIPLPFGEMHTENVSSSDLIRAAIVAQLAKPAVPQSAFRQIANTFKYQILTWIGIIGTAITVFSNLGGILHLADWARELVRHWHEWNQIIWEWLFSLIRLKVPTEWVPIISFIAYVAALVVGVNLSARNVRMSDKSQPAISFRRKIKLLVRGLLLYVLAALGWSVVLVGIGIVLLITGIDLDSYDTLGPITITLAFGVVLIGFPMCYVLYLAEERLWVFVNSLLFLCMGILLFERTQAPGFSPEPALVFTLLLPISWMVVMLFSPVRQLTRRLGFAVLGVVTLVALSEISKLNLHQYLQPTRASDLREHMITLEGPRNIY